jgi:hypothetical protein
MVEVSAFSLVCWLASSFFVGTTVANTFWAFKHMRDARKR